MELAGGEGLQIFARKWAGVGKAKWRGGFVPKWGLSYYTEVFLEIPCDAA